jgi:hypothetical protein
MIIEHLISGSRTLPYCKFSKAVAEFFAGRVLEPIKNNKSKRIHITIVNISLPANPPEDEIGTEYGE